ncbi:hypothetical protein JAAARDRAFT_196127 [Jaapia argillacea MUCL 33604]|uniref:Uncharacterized protein n=1 Tax=Jaapia argillacea MUCL 33604 TaxID=933084 RepID=A0A067PY74_9AGAM|nr:hypothetical protein JAAARDRAFT_196127 [Jaapia argillacea MUCL 33604]
MRRELTVRNIVYDWAVAAGYTTSADRGFDALFEQVFDTLPAKYQAYILPVNTPFSEVLACRRALNPIYRRPQFTDGPHLHGLRKTLNITERGVDFTYTRFMETARTMVTLLTELIKHREVMDKFPDFLL